MGQIDILLHALCNIYDAKIIWRCRTLQGGLKETMYQRSLYNAASCSVVLESCFQFGVLYCIAPRNILEIRVASATPEIEKFKGLSVNIQAQNLNTSKDSPTKEIQLKFSFYGGNEGDFPCDSDGNPVVLKEGECFPSDWDKQKLRSGGRTLFQSGRKGGEVLSHSNIEE